MKNILFYSLILISFTLIPVSVTSAASEGLFSNIFCSIKTVFGSDCFDIEYVSKQSHLETSDVLIKTNSNNNAEKEVEYITKENTYYVSDGIDEEYLEDRINSLKEEIDNDKSDEIFVTKDLLTKQVDSVYEDFNDSIKKYTTGGRTDFNGRSLTVSGMIYGDSIDIEGESVFSGKVGIFEDSPTSFLHVGGGTTATPPIRVGSGNLLLTPQKGSIEFADDRFYITNVGTQRSIDRTSDVITSTTTVSNTVAETAIYTANLGPNDLKVGNVVEVKVSGNISNASAADDITVNVYLGSNLISSTNPPIGNAVNKDWHGTILMTVREVGVSGKIAFHGETYISDQSTQSNSILTVDTTVSEDIAIKVQWDNADPSNVIEIYQGYMTIKN